MSEVAEIEKEVVKKEREPLFSKKNKKLITDPLDDNNPVTIQVLGICSALAEQPCNHSSIRNLFCISSYCSDDAIRCNVCCSVVCIGVG